MDLDLILIIAWFVVCGLCFVVYSENLSVELYMYIEHVGDKVRFVFISLLISSWVFRFSGGGHQGSSAGNITFSFYCNQ